MKLHARLLFIFYLVLPACGVDSNTPAPGTKAAQPNIIMIVVDDLGWSDVGYNQNSKLLETPNIDSLATQGLRFDNAYAGAANCAPSRAVLMSGQYGPRHGIYTVSPSARGDARTRKLIPTKNQQGLKPEVITLAETLKSAGYSTGHFGKWHLGNDPDTQGFDKKGIRDKKHATYAAMVELMDSNVGRILKMLEEENLADDTLVIFTSDNGGYRMSSFPSPIRAGKGSYYEGGIRIPLLMRWPEKIRPDIDSTPVINADFYPTLVSLTNAEPPNQDLDGLDLSASLLGQQAPSPRDLFWHFPVYLQAHHAKTDQGQDPLFRTRPGSAIRSGDWKLIHYFEHDDYELYNLANDIGEQTNLAIKFPHKLNELKEKLQTWRQGIAADMPTDLNPEYDRLINQRLISEQLIELEEK